MSISTTAESSLSLRTTAAVVDDHLRLRERRDLDLDLDRNYAQDVRLLRDQATFRGKEAVRWSAGRLARQLPDARYEILSRQVEGEYALVIWRARSRRCRIDHGVDSFVVRKGRIVMQTIYYDLVELSSPQHQGAVE